MRYQGTFLCATLFVALSAEPSQAWTRHDLVECVSPLSKSPCSIPRNVLTMIRECGSLSPLRLIDQGIDPHDASIACENFVLVNSRSPNLEEIKAQMVAERQAKEATTPVAAHSEQAKSAIQQVRAKLAEGLRDPDSAQFRSEYVIQWNGETYVCGEMNAKNAFGGYVGYRWYMVKPTDDAIGVGVARAAGKTVQCASPNSQPGRQ